MKGRCAMPSSTAFIAYDAHGNQLFEGDRVRNVNKPTDAYTVAAIEGGNFIAVYRGHATIHASQVELVGRVA